MVNLEWRGICLTWSGPGERERGREREGWRGWNEGGPTHVNIAGIDVVCLPLRVAWQSSQLHPVVVI